MAASITRERIDFIDGIRGIAALLVLLMHLLEFNLPASTAITHSWVRFGTIGVAAFFLVSGFVIPMTLERSASLRAFWTGRIFRIYPLYLTVLAASVLIGICGAWPWSAGITADLPRTLVFHLPIVQGFTHGFNFVGGSWTLFIELVFYALFSLCFVLKLHRRHLLLVLGANATVLAMAIAGTVLDRRIPLGHPCLLLCSFTGVMFYRHFRAEVSGRFLIGSVVAALLTTAVAFWHNYSAFHANDFTFTCAMLSWSLAFVMFSGFYLARSWAMAGALTWLGTISYSVYLAHDLVNFGGIDLLGAGWWNMLIVPVLTLPVAWVCHRLIEAPGIRLGKQLVGRSKVHPAAVAPPL